MRKFNSLYVKLNEQHELPDIYTTLANRYGVQPTDVSEDLCVGRYRMRVAGRGFKLKLPEGSEHISDSTGRNLDVLLQNGWEFSELYIVPVRQRRGYAKSYYLKGKDSQKNDIIYARYETASAGAGQTKIYWADQWEKATAVVEPLKDPEEVRRNQIAKLRNDIDRWETQLARVQATGDQITAHHNNQHLTGLRASLYELEHPQ